MAANDRPRFPVRGATPRKPSRRRWVAPALVLGAILGILVGLLFYQGSRPEPVFLAISITQYEHPDWPANPYADSDVRGFRSRFSADAIEAFQSQKKSALRDKLDEAVKKAGSDHPLVIHICALGTVAGDTVYLLPSDAKPEDESTWLPLDDVLTPLGKSAAPKLLVLDLRPVRAPLAVFPTADLSELVESELRDRSQAGKLPFTVFHANTPNEGPSILYPLKQTVFGLALAQGIGGAANGWGSGNSNDNQITVAELTTYVRTTTHVATQAFGWSVQTPSVFGNGADFKLLPVPQDGAAPLPTLPDLVEKAPYPPELQPAWSEADAAVGTGFHLRIPRLITPYLRNAVRAEQRWLAGFEARVATDDWNPKPSAFRETVRSHGPVSTAPTSIARISRLAGLADHGKRAEPILQTVFEMIRYPNPMKKDELTAAIEKIRADKTDPPIPFDEIAANALNTARKLEKPTHEQYRQVFDAANKYRTRKPLAELIALELIAGAPPEQHKRLAGAEPLILESAVAAERVSAYDPRLIPWVAGDIEEADRTRRETLVALLAPNARTDDTRDAPGKLTVAIKLYTTAEDLLFRLQSARTEFEETRAVIDDLGSFGPTNLGPNAAAWETSLVEMADDMRKLDQLLLYESGKKLSVDELSRLTNRLRDARTKCLSRVEAISDRERQTRWPWWTLKERETRIQLLSKSAHESTLRVLNQWPSGPIPEPTAASRRGESVLAESVREMRVSLALAQFQLRGSVEEQEAKELIQEFESRRSSLVSDRKVATEFAKKVYALRRKGATRAMAPIAEWESHRRVVTEYDHRLAELRYQADAAALKRVPFREGYSPVDHWIQLAEACHK